jgi:hypothetical protein
MAQITSFPNSTQYLTQKIRSSSVQFGGERSVLDSVLNEEEKDLLSEEKAAFRWTTGKILAL